MTIREWLRYAAETLLTGPCLIGRHKRRYEPAQEALGHTYPGFDYCPRCTRTWGLTVLPDGHPDNFDGLLTDAQEEWLADLDAQLWPEEADQDLTRAAQERLDRVKEI